VRQAEGPHAGEDSVVMASRSGRCAMRTSCAMPAPLRISRTLFVSGSCGDQQDLTSTLFGTGLPLWGRVTAASANWWRGDDINVLDLVDGDMLFTEEMLGAV